MYKDPTSKTNRGLEIKQKKIEHFSEVFKEMLVHRPILRDFKFRKIGMGDNACFTSEFRVKEIRREVWESDPIPDGGKLCLH